MRPTNQPTHMVGGSLPLGGHRGPSPQPCSLQARRAALRQKLACRATKPDQKIEQLASDSLSSPQNGSRYPDYETDPDTELLPKRQPGNFPSVRPRTHVQKALSVISENIIPGIAGENQPEKDGVAFDPLRDGPLRYLGYANEIG